MEYWQFQEPCVLQLLPEMGFLLLSLSQLEALVDACPKEGIFISSPWKKYLFFKGQKRNRFEVSDWYMYFFALNMWN